MITFKQFMSESIEDKGILKALFVVGLPGAGKSYTLERLKGTISPVIVNTDRPAEFLKNKLGIPITSQTWEEHFRDSSQRITKNMLTNYINGMLPLFVDGTSNDVSNILHRIGILESMGYDVGMLFVHASLDLAKKRAAERGAKTGRYVDEEWIEKIHSNNRENRNYLKSKVNFFREVYNNEDELTDKAIVEAFRKVQGFYLSPVDNPVGRRIVNELRSKKEKYLVPAYLSKEELSRKIEGWYK